MTMTMTMKNQIWEFDPGNYYGNLQLRLCRNGAYEWGVENWDGVRWHPVPDYVAEALIRHHEED